MIDRNSFSSKVFIRSCLGIFVFFVSACTPAVAASTQSPPSTCTSPSLNPYRSHQSPNQVTNIFTNYKNGSVSHEIASQDALSQLGKNVKQWSDHKDVFIDEQRKVRVSITYLDPILVQYVVLNHALVPPNNSMDQTWFTTQIQTAMDNLAKRDEIIFIVTITAPAYENELSINFPIESLKLVNSSEMRVSLTHHDPILGEQVDIAQRSVHGFVGYPVSLSLQGNCSGVVDLWTTSLVLDLKSSPQDDNPFYNLFWNISYQSLLSLQENYRPAPTLDSSYGTNQFNKADTPPTPNWDPNVEMDDANSQKYWEAMGRYIWNEVIMESGH